MLTRLHHGGGEKARDAIDRFDNAREWHAQLAQLGVIEVDVNLFLRDALDAHLGNVLHALDFRLEQPRCIAQGGDVVSLRNNPAVKKSVNICEIVFDPRRVRVGR